MTYTLSNGLRDREYSKFQAVQTGSKTAITVVPENIKIYEFPRSVLTSTGGTGSGLFSTYTDVDLNGILKAIVVDYNDFNMTGSLFLTYSGANTNFEVWRLTSGTNKSNVQTSGAYLVRGTMRTTENTLISGTNSPGMLGDIPMYGTYRLVGSGLGASKSCSGIKLVYQ